MGRAALAFAVSVAAHAVIALALALCLDHAPGPKALATLDLSSVELSFAEKDVESSAAIAPLPPSPPKDPPPRPGERKPDTPVAEARPLPPDPDSLNFKPPEEAVAEMEPPPPPPVVAPEAPRQARIDAPPRPRRTIRPDYPDGARRRGEQGDVVLEIQVDETGAVGAVGVAVSSGYLELDEAAVRAVRAARFTPAKSDGKSVSSAARLKLTFKLR